MKKTLLATALLAIAATAAQAQSPSFGIKAGASLTNAVGDGAEGFDFKNKVGFHGGFVANLPLSDVFSIQPELLYSMKGYKASGIDPSGNPFNNRRTLHYIDVPVLARINAGGLFFEAGPQFGYLVAAKFARDGNASGPAVSYNTRDGYRKVDFGYAAGLGYQLPTGPGIGLRYNGGFKNVQEYYNGRGIRNSAFQLYLTYMFGGK
ncbi:porin family protein [Hymenobacter nivis]|uniref:PorT family protein n=1 Tax=Hymenobacter nivis TaxID=1850093 RepID=A0A502GMH4_9BACT|nr:porin family protein [Hymenobacter nivis]TPG62985.1 PorT family protein [Hymenobacter nivis]